jgi:hypothetical protein
VHKPMKVANGHSLRRQELGNLMRVASGDTGSQEGVIVTFHIAYRTNGSIRSLKGGCVEVETHPLHAPCGGRHWRGEGPLGEGVATSPEEASLQQVLSFFFIFNVLKN